MGSAKLHPPRGVPSQGAASWPVQGDDLKQAARAMSERVTIVLAGADTDSEVAAVIGRLLREDLDSRASRASRVVKLPALDPGRLMTRLRRVHADLAILVVNPESKILEDSCLEAVKTASPECPVLAVLSDEHPDLLAKMLQAGAADFIVAPVRGVDLLPRVDRLLGLRPPEAPLVNRLGHVAGACPILGQSPALLAQLAKLPLVARCDANVLISGETGTGKELFARAIHYLNPRRTGPFVAVNCGAIPAELIENELFGHEAGAYTTAVNARNGLLREATGGSLFLDEVDTLTPSLQVKLLRFLQDKEYRPLGTSKPRHANVRVIAASNIPLEEALRTGHFRRDLYYRLSVLSLELPPLRDRPEDIPVLARHFLAKYAAEFKRPARDFAPGAIQPLLAQSWPGNVRELENVIQRAVLLCETAAVEPHHLGLPAKPRESGDTSFKRLKAQAVRQFERQYLSTLLEEHLGNISAAARAAGKNRRAFWELLRKHQLLPPTLPPGADPHRSALGNSAPPVPNR
jgi:two-component system, NtrC family, response regulator GlrR